MYMIDTSWRLKSLEIGEVYTATEDCIFVGSINAKVGSRWNLLIDDIQLASIGEKGATNIGIVVPSLFKKKVVQFK